MMNGTGLMVIFWASMFLLALGLFSLFEGGKLSVQWETEDVIDNQVFVDQYRACTNKLEGDRVTGSQFKDCLVDSYNLALEN